MSSAPTDFHPADINGVTEEYRTFLETWAAHCGAPASVFTGNLNLVVQAELRAAGEDVVQYARDVAEKHARHWKALDRLTRDLVAFLGEHDCVLAGHIGEGCPDGARLIDRLTTARDVLGLTGTPP